MKRIPFDLKYRSEIEDKQYHLETKDGKPVEIVKWDSNGLAPIVALVEMRECRGEEPVWYDNDGHCHACGFDHNDLVIVTDEHEAPEEIRSLIEEIIDTFSEDALIFPSRKKELIENYSHRLYELALKKIREDVEDFRDADEYYDNWYAYTAPEEKTGRMCFNEGRKYERMLKKGTD